MGSLQPGPISPTPIAHERVVVDASTDEDKTRNNRIRALSGFDVDIPYTSINDPLPSGWVRTDGAILHENSGMTCSLAFTTDDDLFSVQLARLHQFDEQGLDVACSFVSNTSGVITIFSSYWPTITQEDHAANAAQNIRDNFNTVKSLPVPVVELTDEGGTEYEETSAIGYEIDPQSEAASPLKSSLWLVKTGGWHIKARATHAMDDKLTEVFASVMFVRAHLEVRQKNNAAPVGGYDI